MEDPSQPLPILFPSEPRVELPPAPVSRKPPLALALWSPLIGIAFATLFQVVVVVVGLVTSEGPASSDVSDRLTRWMLAPGPLVAILASTQLGFLAAAVLCAATAREPWRQRLGLTAPRIPWRLLPLLIVGTFAAAQIGVLLMTGAKSAGLVPELSKQWADLANSMATAPLGWKIALVIVGSMGPGLCEELLFRGCLQHQLLRRWKPAGAIGFSAVVFAAAHMDPGYILFVIPIGIWLGYIAWRANSILLGIVCHAFINGTVQTMHATGAMNALADDETGFHIGPGVVAVWVAMFGLTALAIVLIERGTRAQPSRLPSAP